MIAIFTLATARSLNSGRPYHHQVGSIDSMSAIDQLLIREYRAKARQRQTTQVESAEPEAGRSADCFTEWEATGSGAATPSEPEHASSTDQRRNESQRDQPPVTNSAGGEAGCDFSPQWEVDRFQWPQVCSDLEQRVNDDLQRAVDTLVGQCQRGKNVLLMTSYSRGEGRTTMALSLAHRAAPGGRRIALVDADLSNPQLSHRLGISAEVGLESVLSGNETLSGACIRSVDEKLSLLPLVRAQNTKNCRWKDLGTALSKLAAHHDLVLVDAGPLSQEMQLLARSARTEFEMGALIVQDSRNTTRQQLQSVATCVHEADLWMAGVVENFAA